MKQKGARRSRTVRAGTSRPDGRTSRLEGLWVVSFLGASENDKNALLRCVVKQDNNKAVKHSCKKVVKTRRLSSQSLVLLSCRAALSPCAPLLRRASAQPAYWQPWPVITLINDRHYRTVSLLGRSDALAERSLVRSTLLPLVPSWAALSHGLGPHARRTERGFSAGAGYGRVRVGDPASLRRV